MTTPALNEPTGSLAAGEPQAPMLPVEGYVVSTVRALEAAKAQAEQTLLRLQYAARDEAEMFGALVALQASVNLAWNSYAAYSELLSCKGQA